MDQARAHSWFAELVGKSIGGWHIDEYLGHGKSALVVRATKNAQAAALKLFEGELVERYGRAVQLARIDRERALIGEVHTSLVRIVDGGESEGILFVVMELLQDSWQQLSSRIGDTPRDKIGHIMALLVDGAMRLEALGLAHRDIKPENIMVTSDFTQAKLMDFGVLRPIGGSDLTDHGGQTAPFIGTLRYSPPEFLMREEKDTLEGWRAITIYQLGGVLHDLIMKKPLFLDYSEPFALLSEAVRTKVPEVDAPDVSPDLLLLCKNALIKDPDLRLRCVEWQSFKNAAQPAQDGAGARRDRVAKRYLASTASNPGRASDDKNQREWSRAMHLAVESVLMAIRGVITADEFPPFSLNNSPIQQGLPCELQLRLSASPGHGVRCPVEISYTVTLVSPADRVCEIAGSLAAPWRALPALRNWADKRYVGVADQEAIRLFVRDAQYELLDAIQSAASGGLE